MNKLTRRAFLWRGSMAAGMAGAVATVPGLPALLATDTPLATSAAETAGPEAAAALPEDAAMTEPLIVHVRDLSTGAMDTSSSARSRSPTPIPSLPSGSIKPPA